MDSLAARHADADAGQAALRASGFVGREPEIAALSQALAVPRAAVWIEGEAGIGKSRLLREYLASPAGRASRVLVARCPPLRHPQTLAPVVDAVRHAADRVAGLRLSPLAGALRPLFPEWSADLPPALEPAEDATAVRHRVFRALTELLGSLQVSVLAVEDAHWADEATVEFLLFLAAGIPRPVSLVVTSRPEDVPAGSLLRRLATRLDADSAGRLRLSLGPLDKAATAQMVSSMLVGPAVSEEFADFVHQRTEGVPLAVEGSVRLMADREDLAFRGGQWKRRRLDRIGVPATIRDMVTERLERLGPGTRAVLAAAAVLGGPAGEPTIQAVAGLDADSAHAGLCDALDAGLLDDDGQGRVDFRHVLARQAVDEALPAPRRRLLHQRAGEALSGLPQTPPAELAEHFREAGDQDQWSRYSEQAADLALASGDEAGAGALLHDLIVSAALPAPSVIRLIRKVPFASFTSPARYRELAASLRTLLERGPLPPATEADVRVQLGYVLLLVGEDDAGREQLEQAIPHLDHDPQACGRAMIQLGWPRGTSMPAADHLRWLQRAADLSAESATPAARLSHVCDQVTARLMLGEEDGWVLAGRIPADAPDSAQRQQITRAYCNTGDMAMLWGRYDLARDRLDRAVELAGRHGYQRYRSMARATLVRLDWLTGRWDGLAARAAALAGSGEDILPLSRLEALLVTGLLAAASGAHAEAARHLQAVLDGQRPAGVLSDSMEPAAALARLALAAGDSGQALEVTAGPAGIIARKGTWVWAADLGPARVAALTAAGEVEEAAEFTGAFARGLAGRDAPGPRAGLHSCQAIIAESRAGNPGEQARGAQAFAVAAAAWAALPRPHEALLARESQARCLLAAGERESAVALLESVRGELIALGAPGDADRVVTALREQGVAARRAQRGGRRPYGDQLSPREQEVTALAATGLSNRAIAAKLHLSMRTVDQHLSRAMRKLGVSSRTALAVRAVGSGIAAPLSPPERGSPATPRRRALDLRARATMTAALASKNR